MPLRTSDNTDHPLSLYGATKKVNELLAQAYASLFGSPTTGLRFFTVYGPWGRPDMAMWLFTVASVSWLVSPATVPVKLEGFSRSGTGWRHFPRDSRLAQGQRRGAATAATQPRVAKHVIPSLRHRSCWKKPY
jgi:hypothetical protein